MPPSLCHNEICSKIYLRPRARTQVLTPRRRRQLNSLSLGARAYLVKTATLLVDGLIVDYYV